MAKKYRMRNDLVLIRKVKPKLVRGLHMPDRSAEGTNFFVVACGPDVKDLKEGDQIMLAGAGDEKFFPVPGELDLLMANQKLIAYVVEQGEVLA